MAKSDVIGFSCGQRNGCGRTYSTLIGSSIVPIAISCGEYQGAVKYGEVNCVITIDRKIIGGRGCWGERSCDLGVIVILSICSASP